MLKDKKLLIEVPEPFKIIQQALAAIPEAQASFEPAKTPIFSTERTKQAIAEDFRPE